MRITSSRAVLSAVIFFAFCGIVIGMLRIERRDIRSQFLQLDNERISWRFNYLGLTPYVDDAPFGFNGKLSEKEIYLLRAKLRDEKAFEVAHLYLSVWWAKFAGEDVWWERQANEGVSDRNSVNWCWNGMIVSPDRENRYRGQPTEMKKLQDIWDHRIELWRVGRRK